MTCKIIIECDLQFWQKCDCAVKNVHMNITLINKFWMIECYGYVNTLSLCFFFGPQNTKINLNFFG